MLFTLAAACPRRALAGDPEAHAQAIEIANYTVANDTAYVNGLGAPLKAGVPQMGKFLVPNRQAQPCPFTPSAPFGSGCAYATLASEAINEPDAWICGDSRQPELMTAINSFIAPYQTDFANALASRVSEVAMVCNWNHFTSNAALPLNGNRNADAAYTLTLNWANEIPDAIEKNGATSDAACDSPTFARFLQRVYNALHYVQDETCEHHATGNLVCTNTDVIPIFNSNPIYNFTQGRACMTFLGDTLQNAVGATPKYLCDEAVMAPGTTADVELNENMYKVGSLCGFPGAVNGTRLVFTARYPVMSLACAGLERTLRHHCLLATPKTLTCFGPPSDHQSITPDGTWCEGENYPGPGGQDFVSAAEAASEPVLRTAWSRFAGVCKQPDDPCVDAQCAQWCQRTVGRADDGFCVNSSPDASCKLHECKCDLKTNCGGAGQPCCHGSAPCADQADECGGMTGTCEPKGQESCNGSARVFVTSLGFVANLDTASGGPGTAADGAPFGDKICTAAAKSTNLGGTWKAWLPSSSSGVTTTALDRVGGTGPWTLVDGTTVVFASHAGLTSAAMHAIDHDERGKPSPPRCVWTGTDTGGGASASFCNSWTSVSMGNTATVGNPVGTADWTNAGTFTCDGVCGLYCFEQ